MKIILSFLILLSLAFLVPSDAFGAITPATVTDGDSRFIAGGAATSPRHVEFNTDGTKMFIVGGTLDFVYEWTLTTGFDISTATYAGNAEAFDLFKNNSNGFGDGQPRGIHFNTDGTKMFVVGNNADEINEYSLSTGFDISSGGNSISAFTASEDITATVGAFPQGIEFNTDGTKMFVTESIGSNQLHEFTLTTGFNLSTMVNDGTHVTSDVLSDTLLSPHGIAFSKDGTKMFVVSNDRNGINSNDSVNEYSLSSGFDITTASFTHSFDVSDRAHDPHGVEFNTDGTKMFIMDTKLPSQSGTGYLYEYILSCPWQLTGTCGEFKKHRDCYDCEAPKLTKVEVHITSQNSDTQRISTSSEIWHFDQKSPYPMFGDDITPIIADPGDEVEIILELTDNRTLKRIADSGTYANFLTKPDDMNTFYANNFDEYGKISTTYYEWHQTGEDLVYDYDNTVEWSDVDVTIEESGELDNRVCCNQDDLAGTFTISFKMKFLQPMQTTDVWVQATDRSGNFFKVALPLTLKISGNEPLLFESKVNQKVLSFFDESMLSEVVSDWSGTSQDVSELAKILGIPDEQLPSWVTNLAVWVSEDRITLADMIVSIEHLINN